MWPAFHHHILPKKQNNILNTAPHHKNLHHPLFTQLKSYTIAPLFKINHKTSIRSSQNIYKTQRLPKLKLYSLAHLIASPATAIISKPIAFPRPNAARYNVQT